MYKTREQMKQETEAAKSTDIIQLMQNMGYTVKRTGTSYKCKEVDGLVLFPNTNSYFNYYQNKGGSTIDMVMDVMGCSMSEAISYILAYKDYDISYERQKNVNPEVHNRNKSNSKELTLPESNDNYRRAFAYLAKSRCIDSALIQELMHKKRIYESKDNHNVVFLATDKNGSIKHGFIRGTLTGVQYRGDTAGSNKDYGFNIKGSNDTLTVMEAPIDLLSYKTLFPTSRNHLLATGMLAINPIYKYIEEHPEIKTISFLFDNDEPGLNACKQFGAELESRGYTVTVDGLYKEMQTDNVKDVNEYLCNRCKNRAKEQKYDRGNHR
jgi:hypothetical protein